MIAGDCAFNSTRHAIIETHPVCLDCPSQTSGDELREKHYLLGNRDIKINM